MKFSYSIMHISKDMLGIGLIKPKMLITMQVLKLYLSNKYMRSSTSKVIDI